MVNETLIFILVFVVFIAFIFFIVAWFRKISLKRLQKNYDEKEDISRRRFEEGRTLRSVEEAEPVVARLREPEGRSVFPTTAPDSVGRDQDGDTTRVRKDSKRDKFLRRIRRKR